MNSLRFHWRIGQRGGLCVWLGGRGAHGKGSYISWTMATAGASSKSMALSLRARARYSWLGDGLSHCVPCSEFPRPEAGIAEKGTASLGSSECYGRSWRLVIKVNSGEERGWRG